MADISPLPDKPEIRFNGVRNGDRLGHDHLDSAEIILDKWVVKVNDAGIFITYPYYIRSSYSYRVADAEIVLDDPIIISPDGRVTRNIKAR